MCQQENLERIPSLQTKPLRIIHPRRDWQGINHAHRANILLTIDNRSKVAMQKYALRRSYTADNLRETRCPGLGSIKKFFLIIITSLNVQPMRNHSSTAVQSYETIFIMT